MAATPGDLEDAWQHGLGLGLNATENNPWKSKRYFQLRPRASQDDIWVIREPKTEKYSRSAVKSRDLFFSAEGNSGALIQTVKLGMDTSFSRKLVHSQKVAVTKVKTRTVAFKVDDESETWFEKKLREAVNFDSTRNDAEYKQTLRKACEGYVKEHSVTHYTAAITLGAMKCEVEGSEEQATQMSSGVTASVVAPILEAPSATVRGKHSHTSKTEQKEMKRFGTFAADDSVTEEAVIEIEMVPIYTLVQETPKLAEALKDAVAMYCSEGLPKCKFVSLVYMFYKGVEPQFFI